MDWDQLDSDLEDLFREWTERAIRSGCHRVMTPYLRSLIKQELDRDSQNSKLVDFVIFDSLRQEMPQKVEDGIE